MAYHIKLYIMRRYLNRNDNKIGFNFEGLSFQNIVVREVTPVDEFYFQRSISSDDSKECIAFTDPIRMLFNQQRLQQLGSTAAAAWLDSLKNFNQDPFAEIRSKCSDADLKSIIKSRHIQQPSELLAYADWCKNNIDMFNSEVQKLIEARDTEIKAREAQRKAKDELTKIEPQSVNQSTIKT